MVASVERARRVPRGIPRVTVRVQKARAAEVKVEAHDEVVLLAELLAQLAQREVALCHDAGAAVTSAVLALLRNVPRSRVAVLELALLDGARLLGGFDATRALLGLCDERDEPVGVLVRALWGTSARARVSCRKSRDATGAGGRVHAPLGR